MNGPTINDNLNPINNITIRDNKYNTLYSDKNMTTIIMGNFINISKHIEPSINLSPKTINLHLLILGILFFHSGIL